MTKYYAPKLPTKYWVNSLQYLCENCKKIFEIDIPKGDDIVKFENQDLSQMRWLPVYGDNGYISLFKKFYPSYKGEMYPKIVNEFITKLNNHIEKVYATDYYQISYDKHECIYCKSRRIKILKENVLENPNLDWMKLDFELMQK